MKTPRKCLIGLVTASVLSSAHSQDVPLPPPIPVPIAPAEKSDTPSAGATDAAAPTTAASTTKTKDNYSLHEVKPGGSMSFISANAYRRPGYWRILKLHNGVSPEKLQAGQMIKAPDLDWLLADSGLTAKYPEVVKDFMLARKMFMEMEDANEAKIQNDTIAPSEEDQKKIAEAQSLIAKCRETLMAKKDGVTSPPSATILQLRTASQKMGLVSKGTSKAAITQNLVHEHFSNAMVYAVLWARDGFK